MDGDNWLPIDMDQALAVDSFIDLVKSRSHATLAEMFPSPEALCCQGPDGRYVHELIVPFEKIAESPVSRGSETPFQMPAPVEAVNRRERRAFPPGSDWLYVKLYSGAATADDVLRSVVGPLTKAALRSGAADFWYFVRYGDPDWHLRLRLHGNPNRLQREVFPELMRALRPMVDDGRIWRVQLDTYERELERYGGFKAMELVERLFHIDSEATLNIIETYRGDTGADARWRLALLGIDLMMTDIGLNLQEKEALTRRLRHDYASEFHVDGELQKQIAGKLRGEKRQLEELLLRHGSGMRELETGIAILTERSSRTVPIMQGVTDLVRSNEISVPLLDLGASLLHMHANRALRTAHRAQEMVIYHFLSHLYSSARARMGMNSLP